MSLATDFAISYWCMSEDYHDRCNGTATTKSSLSGETLLADCRCECHKTASAAHVAPQCEVAGEASRDVPPSPRTPASRLAELSSIERRTARFAAIDAVQEMNRIAQEDEAVWHSLSELAELVTTDEDVTAGIYERFNELMTSAPLSYIEIAAEYGSSDELVEALHHLTRCENGACNRLGIAAAPGSLLCESCQAEAADVDPMDMEGDR